jgi:uncharacterized membrane protein YoaK (UPF0700 family)
MVKTKKAFFASIISSFIVGAIYYIANTYVFNNPALAQSNITMVGITVVVSVFLLSYFGMTWRKK